MRIGEHVITDPASSPVRGRSSGSQKGLRRKRTSTTQSASTGDRTCTRRRRPRPGAEPHRPAGHQLDDALAQLLGAQLAAVDDGVSRGAEAGEQLVFVPHRRRRATGRVARMGAGALGEAPEEHRVGGGEVYDPHPGRGDQAGDGLAWRASTTAAARRPPVAAAQPGRRSRPRLSTTSTPAASRARAAVAFPAPLMPVRIQASGVPTSAVISPRL